MFLSFLVRAMPTLAMTQLTLHQAGSVDAKGYPEHEGLGTHCKDPFPLSASPLPHLSLRTLSLPLNALTAWPPPHHPSSVSSQRPSLATVPEEHPLPIIPFIPFQLYLWPHPSPKPLCPATVSVSKSMRVVYEPWFCWALCGVSFRDQPMQRVCCSHSGRQSWDRTLPTPTPLCL